MLQVGLGPGVGLRPWAAFDTPAEATIAVAWSRVVCLGWRLGLVRFRLDCGWVRTLFGSGIRSDLCTLSHLMGAEYIELRLDEAVKVEVGVMVRLCIRVWVHVRFKKLLASANIFR